MTLCIENPYERLLDRMKFYDEKYEDSHKMWTTIQEVKKDDFTFTAGGDGYKKKHLTTYRQDYCQLPKLKTVGIAKKHMKPWQAENKVKMPSVASVPKHTSEVTASKRSANYETETSVCFKAPPKESLLMDSQRCATPRDFSVDFFKPNISAKLYPVFEKGYPAFAVPEYTGIPPQLAKHVVVTGDPNAIAYRPLYCQSNLSSMTVGNKL